MYQTNKENIFISSYELTNSFPGTAFQFSATSTVLKIHPCSTDYGVDKYDIGERFGHFGIANEDASIINLQ
jgi:hypothetical protein